jgi:hypothetical protein
VNGVAFDLHSRIELAAGEVAASLNGAMVSHLDYPGARRTLRAIKDCALALDEKEQILHEIFGFVVVPKDASGYVPNDSRIALK